MSAYPMPSIKTPPPVTRNEVLLIASGDLRQDANRIQWPAQAEMETRLAEAFAREGYTIRRAHPFIQELEHGFIWSQRMGMDVFAHIHPEARLVVAEAVWQYSHHVLPGLRSHRGPILTVANWSGKWSGLVGMLNLNGCLVKAGVPFSTLWSESFEDPFFVDGIRQWLKTGKIFHDTSHIRDLDVRQLPAAEAELGKMLAQQLRQQKAILGVFDEGCMGMYNAIIDDELLNPMGIYKERLSQSALVAAMRTTPEGEALAVRRWLEERGLKFITGPDPIKHLTDDQILEQCKMYIAALRIAAEFGCAAIGIQYQQGLKDMTPASDLVEGMLNNLERPPVYHAKSGQELYPGQALPHFNEVDEGAGVDALVTNRVWLAMGLDPATTLHDLRWGEYYQGDGIDDFVWVFMISGAAPASHFIDGYRGASSERQRHMFFPLGGGTLKGVYKPGELVWSRVFVERGRIHADLGRATAVRLPEEETRRRWRATSPEWPLLLATLHGVSRDQMMARQRANHISVAYAPSAETADKALAAKAAMLVEMGVQVHLCGV
jgi:L-fucose isomerase-like protein